MRFTVSLGVLLTGAVFLGGCGKQSEGEICEISNGNEDCDSGLECVSHKALLDDSADRCCPPGEVTDLKCRRGGRFDDGETGGSAGGTGLGGEAGTAAAGGSAAVAGSAAAAGSGGEAGAGRTCEYTSDCGANERCGPLGRCIAQCKADVDCYPGQVCDGSVCVPAPVPSAGAGGA